MDDKYIYPCIVFLTSLLDNRAKSTFYMIHILGNNKLTNFSKEKINKIIERFGNNSANVIYYNLEGYFKNATVWHIPVATYYKILLPSLLPNVDKIIFTDADIINLEDLSEMYNIEFKENMYYGGTADFIDHLNQLKENGLSSDKYLNTGVVLMNLKALRENSIEKKLTDFIATHYLKFQDQTAINCVCYKHIQIIHYKYNLFAFPSINRIIDLNNQQDIKYRLNESELDEAINKPTLFHYVDLDKPWLKRTTKFNRVYWWYYVKMSGFYQEILDFYKFDKSDIESLLKQIPEDGGLLKRNYKKLN
jgi:lipopolysaccharide biosynthesis glycosyltransferase